MTYFVTGATGFIGRNLIARLLEREGTIYVLVRPRSWEKLDALIESWGPAGERVVPVPGDLSESNLGVDEKIIAELRGKIDHFFHLAAVYSLSAPAEAQDIANILGTDHAIEFAEAVEAGVFHHCSSIAAAGLYHGVFREDMFEEASGLEHAYFRTKHESEGLVRQKCRRPWRIYRPAIVVGHSETGIIDKIDGPYYFFKLIQKMRKALPSWMPTIGLEGGRINLVPVDFVATAMDHIAHVPDQDGKCFHLTDPDPQRVGEVLNLFARAGHAPQMTLRLDTRMFGFIPATVRQGLAALPPVRRITNQILSDLGIPREVLRFVNYPTRFDSRNTEALLKDTGIKVPALETYAWRLWDYWERHLDPDLFVDRSLGGAVKGKVVLVTGASSGIGKTTAIRLGEVGARVLICARHEEKLLETKQEIEALGGTVEIYRADLADMADCDRLVEQVLKDHGGVDVLVNNAGRSIRRAIANSFDRFHDFERTMQLNYFGALRTTLGLLPSMAKRKRGHVINISSIGVLSNAPRFSAYVASKAALEAFSRCAAAEYSDLGIKFTVINMPLVRTPMIEPTKIYQHMPTISTEEAADLVSEAIISKPLRIATRLGIFAQIMHLLLPRFSEVLMNTGFRMFPESAASKGVKKAEEKASNEMIAFASFMRGIHW